MAKAGRKPRKGEVKGGAPLIEALKFIAPAQRKSDSAIKEPYLTHCVFHGGFVMAFDGMLTIGHPIMDDIHACPNSFKMLDALNNCGQELAITQLDSGRLSIKSGSFKALVPCCTLEEMPYFGPDVKCATIDERVINAISNVMNLIEENGAKVHLASVLLQANTAVSTCGTVLLESWHGIDLPPNMLLPRVAAKAICATGKKPTGFGYSGNSATFFFEDGSYIKTQLFQDSYVAYQKVFAENPNPNAWDLPVNFFEAIGAVSSFSEQGCAFFHEGLVSSHPDTAQGATFEIEGLPVDKCYSIELLQLVKHAMHKVEFMQHKVFFFSNDGITRGVVMGRSWR